MAEFGYKPLLTLLACGLLLAAGGAWLHAGAARAPAHPLGTACADCHLAGEDVTPQQAGMLVASQEAMCAECHPKATQVSHPSGFAPRRQIPAGFPLDWKGDLTCSTCHEVHGDIPGLLRTAQRGRSFCIVCHDNAFFDRMRDGGASLMLSGHLNVPGAVPLDLDSYSLQCMQCHIRQGDSDGSLIDPNGVLRHAAGSVNHPIGKVYAKAASYGGFRPEVLLSKSVLLPEGKISCVSCHLGYSKEHGKVVALAGRSLCMECHDI